MGLWKLIKQFFSWLVMDQPRDITDGITVEEIKQIAVKSGKVSLSTPLAGLSSKAKKMGRKLEDKVVSSKVLKNNLEKVALRDRRGSDKMEDLDPDALPVSEENPIKKLGKLTTKATKRPTKKAKKSVKNTTVKTTAQKKKTK